MISKETIDEIYAAAQIEEVVADFVPLKRRGQNWVGVCPFHNDKNPSRSLVVDFKFLENFIIFHDLYRLQESVIAG